MRKRINRSNFYMAVRTVVCLTLFASWGTMPVMAQDEVSDAEETEVTDSPRRVIKKATKQYKMKSVSGT